MDIAAMNMKITIQQNSAISDKYGNHKNEWEDYFSCHATISGENGMSNKEQEAAGMTVENTEINFTVRYCSKTVAVTSTKFRIVFNGELYDIVAIDHLSYKKKALKFRCRKARR